jgi:hypothetical protein
MVFALKSKNNASSGTKGSVGKLMWDFRCTVRFSFFLLSCRQFSNLPFSVTKVCQRVGSFKGRSLGRYWPNFFCSSLFPTLEK